MPICNRRMFMSHLVVGTAALAVVGRAYADTSASGAPAATTPTTGTSPNPSSSTGCGNCAFYTPAASGENSGTCAFARGKAVSVDDGCGHFTPQ
jgi:hypothetical protein